VGLISGGVVAVDGSRFKAVKPSAARSNSSTKTSINRVGFLGRHVVVHAVRKQKLLMAIAAFR
jgi:hypothetical protein